MQFCKCKKSNANERGASLFEYAILVALISVVSIAGIQAFGSQISEKYTKIGWKVEAVGTEQGGDSNF